MLLRNQAKNPYVLQKPQLANRNYELYRVKLEQRFLQTAAQPSRLGKLYVPQATATAC